MATKIHSRAARRPKRRTGEKDEVQQFFYPGEVARILDLEGIDYRQLREIFRILHPEHGSGWARFSFRDLVAVRHAVELAGGRQALSGEGRRLKLKKIRLVCERLRHDYGIENPLAAVAMRRQGNAIVAQIEGVAFEPATGQLVLNEVAEAVDRYLKTKQPAARQKQAREAARQEAAAARKLDREVGRLAVGRRGGS